MNWLGFQEKPKVQQPETQLPKQMPQRQESTDSVEGVQLGDRRASITLADVPQASMQRRESDIDRLYRLSNMIHGFGKE